MPIEGQSTPGTGEEVKATEGTRDLSACVMIDEITPQILLKDLEAGRTREDIRKRYAYMNEDNVKCELEKWMVDHMFKDPLLVGKKTSKKRRLPFQFAATEAAPASAPEETPEVEAGQGEPGVEASGELPEEEPQAAMTPEEVEASGDPIDLG